MLVDTFGELSTSFSEPISVSYRGHEDLLWKMDYARLYLALFQDLEVVQEQRFVIYRKRECR